MNADERHRLATMIDIVLRDSTTGPERVAAIGRLTSAASGKSMADLVKEILAEAPAGALPRYTPPPPSERERPWLEWKAKHEETVAECDRLRRRVAVLESQRYANTRVKPDAEGNVPYRTFLVALLAARDWMVQDALVEFGYLAEVNQMDVTHWRKRDKVPFHYYQILADLPFEGVRKRIIWTEEDIAMLREYYANDAIPRDIEVAKDMTLRSNKRFSEWGVHCKAQSLGLLAGKKREGRRLKTSKARAAETTA